MNAATMQDLSDLPTPSRAWAEEIILNLIICEEGSGIQSPLVREAQQAFKHGDYDRVWALELPAKMEILRGSS